MHASGVRLAIFTDDESIGAINENPLRDSAECSKRASEALAPIVLALTQRSAHEDATRLTEDCDEQVHLCSRSGDLDPFLAEVDLHLVTWRSLKSNRRELRGTLCLAMRCEHAATCEEAPRPLAPQEAGARRRYCLLRHRRATSALLPAAPHRVSMRQVVSASLLQHHRARTASRCFANSPLRSRFASCPSRERVALECARRSQDPTSGRSEGGKQWKTARMVSGTGGGSFSGARGQFTWRLLTASVSRRDLTVESGPR